MIQTQSELSKQEMCEQRPAETANMTIYVKLIKMKLIFQRRGWWKELCVFPELQVIVGAAQSA